MKTKWRAPDHPRRPSICREFRPIGRPPSASSRRAARFQKAREVTALAQLRDVQAGRARAGIPLPWPVAVALILPVRAALATRDEDPRNWAGTAPVGERDTHCAARGRVRRIVAAPAEPGLCKVPPRRETHLHPHRQRDGLKTFLQDGRVEIYSHAVENLISPIALTRKNELFAGHDEGGRTWGGIASLVATEMINGIEHRWGVNAAYTKQGVQGRRQ